MRRPPQGVILLYHRVFDYTSDPQLLCVTPRHFGEHLDHLKREYALLGMGELVAALRERTPTERAVVVTFDDGYADNSWNAKPLLEQYHVPATMHIATEHLGHDAEFWWDELEQLLLASERLPNSFRILDRTWKTITRQQIYGDLHRLLRPLSVTKRQTALFQLRDQIENAPAPRSTHRILNQAELRSLADCELIEIGAHTVSHTMLASLSVEEQRWEMRESKMQLETILGRAVNRFAYPYGGRKTVSRQTTALAKECGFESACSTVSEPVRPGSDLFFLPRFLVRDWSGEEFAQKLWDFWG